MSALHLNLFAAATDAEAARYRVLAGLKEAHTAFVRSLVYPHLADLIRLRRALRDLLDGVEHYREGRTGRIKGVDWESQEVLFDPPDGEAPLLAEDLAHWALPQLTKVIEEGRTLFEFVDEHAALEAVGVVPAYQDEGYLILPDEAGNLFVLRYTMSALTGEDGKYRSLRTRPVAADLPPLAPPRTWKVRLVERYPDLPRPATFRLDADVAFPLEATMLPIAKRKLLRMISDRGEA